MFGQGPSKNECESFKFNHSSGKSRHGLIRANRNDFQTKLVNFIEGQQTLEVEDYRFMILCPNFTTPQII